MTTTLHAAKVLASLVSIAEGAYLAYSAFCPSLLSRRFFDEVGSPVEYIPIGAFLGLLVPGLVFTGGGVLLIARWVMQEVARAKRTLHQRN